MRVLELSDEEGAAAFCARLFVRSGVEVVKVERPTRLAPERSLDLYLNAGKRRVALDRSASQDFARIVRLAETCDALITDADAREVEELDLLNLRGGGVPLVRTSITPFGLSGPYKEWAATCSTLLALSGHTYLMGDPDRAPLTMAGNYPLYQAGIFAFISTMAAHLEADREASPAIQIEVSALEALSSLHQFTDVMWTMGRRIRARHGNRWENLEPTSLLPCADGWFGVNILQNFWQPFALMLGRTELSEEPNFATNSARMTRRDEVEAIIVEAFKDWPKKRIFKEGQETWRVPVGYLMTMAEALEDEHLRHRRFWRTAPDQYGGKRVRVPGQPFRVANSDIPDEASVSAPGADTEAVLNLLPGHPSPTVRPGGPLSSTKPLTGVRIVDLTRIWSGPLVTRILGDLGADIIKVEAPTGRGPAVIPQSAGGYYPDGGPGDRPWNRQGLFNKLNRNKRGVAIDLKTEEGRDLFLRLVEKSDVVIENFSARAMPSLNLGYETLRQANEKIIYLSMPAFGLDGPYRDYVGLGPSIEPLTGLTAVQGYSRAEPRVTAIAITDPMAGTLAAAALMSALEARRRTGEGAYIDFSQHEAGVTFVGEYFIEHQLTGRDPKVVGNAHHRFAPHGVYRCRGEDEWIAMAVRDNGEWNVLAELARRRWDEDARFATATLRLTNRETLDREISAWTLGQDKFELMTALQKRGLAAGAVLSAPEWLDDPHLKARGYFAELDHPDAGPVSTDGSPVVINGDRGYDRWLPAPGLGEHNSQVFHDLLGLSSEEIAAFYASKAITDRPPP